MARPIQLTRGIYEAFVDYISRLQNCLKMMGIIDDVLVPRINLLSKAKSCFAISAALWISDAPERGFSIAVIELLRAKLSNYIESLPIEDRDVLLKLIRLSPAKLKMDHITLGHKCLIPSHIAIRFSKVLILLNDLIENPYPREDRAVEPRYCISSAEYLPPALGLTSQYVEIMLKSFKAIERLKDVDLSVVEFVDAVERKLEERVLNQSDALTVAAALLTTIRTYNVNPCVEPLLGSESVAAKVYSDLSSMGVYVTDSDLYQYYKVLSDRLSRRMLAR